MAKTVFTPRILGESVVAPYLRPPCKEAQGETAHLPRVLRRYALTPGNAQGEDDRRGKQTTKRSHTPDDPKGVGGFQIG